MNVSSYLFLFLCLKVVVAIIFFIFFVKVDANRINDFSAFKVGILRTSGSSYRRFPPKSGFFVPQVPPKSDSSYRRILRTLR